MLNASKSSSPRWFGQRFIASSLAALAFVASVSSHALTPKDRVENFRLTDHQGASHELYRMGDKKALAFMVQGNGCPIVRNAMPEFKALRDEFQGQGVGFFMLNANLQDNRQSVAAEADEFGYDIPILVDETQVIGESLGLVRTGEVFVVDPKTWQVIYAGAMDDRLTYERQRERAKDRYLRDALQSQIQGEPIATAKTDAVGCLINFPTRQAKQPATITYTEHVAPILERNCVSCHRAGGIGPWAMTDYKMVRGFSLMIREVLRTQRMPPWHADPTHGQWANDRSLTNEEIATIVHWAEAGAPRGEGADPLIPAATQQYPEWALGEPDLILEIPPTKVPATGTVEYQYQTVKNPLDRDVWVKATAILPGDRSALHHVITTFSIADEKGRVDSRAGRIRGALGGYVPGMAPRTYPDNTGVLLPKGAMITFQMHYTSYGKASTDKSRMGMYFHTAAPAHNMQTKVLMNTKIKIPAHSNGHSETAKTKLKEDVLVYSLLPHAHFRGKASEFRAFYPDGREEVLLSVPNYDFNWQTTYQLAEPKVLPKDTVIVHRTWWDNSATNPANPDPDRDVPWGQQSWDEMLFGTVNYRSLTPAEVAERRHANSQPKGQKLSQTQVTKNPDSTAEHARLTIDTVGTAGGR